ncbi:hypothetical protein ABCW43_00230 [Neorhizobium sp. IRAMC:178]|uniref:hypothetical protein n=1 Tax=Neorhizobium tunisiense TaxID=3144793 RepID=UPI0031F6D708
MNAYGAFTTALIALPWVIIVAACAVWFAKKRSKSAGSDTGTEVPIFHHPV